MHEDMREGFLEGFLEGFDKGLPGWGRPGVTLPRRGSPVATHSFGSWSVVSCGVGLVARANLAFPLKRVC